jgi:hypothetical protein
MAAIVCVNWSLTDPDPGNVVFAELEKILNADAEDVRFVLPTTFQAVVPKAGFASICEKIQSFWEDAPIVFSYTVCLHEDPATLVTSPPP